MSTFKEGQKVIRDSLGSEIGVIVSGPHDDRFGTERYLVRLTSAEGEKFHVFSPVGTLSPAPIHEGDRGYVHGNLRVVTHVTHEVILTRRVDVASNAYPFWLALTPDEFDAQWRPQP